MGCIECEVPAVVTRGRGGERTLEKGRKKPREEFRVLTMRNTLSCWQKKQKPLPITGREEREREDERRKVGRVGRGRVEI